MTSPLERILRELAIKLSAIHFSLSTGNIFEKEQETILRNEAISTACNSIKGLMPEKRIENIHTIDQDEVIENIGFNSCLDELNKNLWGGEE